MTEQRTPRIYEETTDPEPIPPLDPLAFAPEEVAEMDIDTEPQDSADIDWKATAEALSSQLRFAEREIKRLREHADDDLREDLAHARNALRERNRLYGRASTTIGEQRWALSHYRAERDRFRATLVDVTSELHAVCVQLGREFASPTELRDRIADLVEAEARMKGLEK